MNTSRSRGNVTNTNSTGQRPRSKNLEGNPGRHANSRRIDRLLTHELAGRQSNRRRGVHVGRCRAHRPSICEVLPQADARRQDNRVRRMALQTEQAPPAEVVARRVRHVEMTETVADGEARGRFELIDPSRGRNAGGQRAKADASAGWRGAM